MIDTVLAWLATYLIHSSALILAVWGFTRWTSLDPLTRSLLWKIALVGGLFTASLQTGLDIKPALGRVSVGTPETPPIVAEDEEAIEEVALAEEITADITHELVVVEVDDGAESVTIVSMHGGAGPAWEPMPVAAPMPVVAASEPAPAEEGGGGVSAALLGLFLGGSILGLGRLAFTARRLRRLLQGRQDILRGSLAEKLAVLLARARLGRRAVRLTMSPALVSPIALASREIVVPEEASQLEQRQQEAMLAHELAHVVRQDPAWLVLAAVIEAGLFIQPLNRLARAGMQEAAEELADDWAVRHLGTGLHLARCLTEVASWHGRGTPGPFVSPMASGSGSALVQRVQRLLDDRSRERGPWAGVGRLMVGGLLLAGVAWGAPGISVGEARAEASASLDVEEEIAVPAAGFEGFAPMLAMHTMAGEAAVIAAQPEPTARQQRLLRRAARQDRKAERARAKAGVQVVIREDVLRVADGGRQVVIVRDAHDEHDEDHVVHVRGPGWPIDRAEVDRIRAEAMRAQAEAMRGGHFDHEEAARLHEEAQEHAREAARAGREAAREAARAGREAAREAERAVRDAARDQAREAARAGREAAREAERAVRDAARDEARRVRDQARATGRGPGFDPADIERLREHAEAVARSAPNLKAEDLDELQRQAEAVARDAEALAERAEGLSAGDAVRLFADAARVARDHHALGEEEMRRIERAAEAAAKIDTGAIERQVQAALEQAPGLDEATKRRIREDVRRELGKADRKQAAKEREKAAKEREKAAKEREKAAKEREKARAKQSKDI